MKKIFAATMIAAAALAGTAASANDNPAQESQAKLQKLWGHEQAYATGSADTGGQVSASRIETDRPNLSTSYFNRAKGTSAAALRLQQVQPTPAGR